VWIGAEEIKFRLKMFDEDLGCRDFKIAVILGGMSACLFEVYSLRFKVFSRPVGGDTAVPL
jgi:hypothetical protein